MTFLHTSDLELTSLRDLTANLGPTRDLERLLGAAERFCDPMTAGGFAENLRKLKDTAREIRERVGGEPEGIIPR